MEVRTLEKIRGIFLILLVGYIVCLSAAFPLAIWIRHEDSRTSDQKVYFDTPDWFYLFIAFGFPLIVSIVMLGTFLWNTRHRKRDPYRFSRVQSRSFDLSATKSFEPTGFLIRLGYEIISNTTQNDRRVIVGRRSGVPKSAQFSTHKFPTPHEMQIEETKLNDQLSIQARCYPISKIVVADFKNTIYDAIEELSQELVNETKKEDKPRLS